MLIRTHAREALIAFALVVHGGPVFSQDAPTGGGNLVMALSSCANNAVATSGATNLAAIKTACAEQYQAVAASLPDNVRTDTMASLDRMMAGMIPAQPASN